MKQKLKIDGMHCNSCALNIDFALEDLPGVKSAQTNYASSTLEVEYDPEKIKLETILGEVKKTGYSATIPV